MCVGNLLAFDPTLCLATIGFGRVVIVRTFSKYLGGPLFSLSLRTTHFLRANCCWVLNFSAHDSCPDHFGPCHSNHQQREQHSNENFLFVVCIEVGCETLWLMSVKVSACPIAAPNTPHTHSSAGQIDSRTFFVVWISHKGSFHVGSGRQMATWNSDKWKEQRIGNGVQWTKRGKNGEHQMKMTIH